MLLDLSELGSDGSSRRHSHVGRKGDLLVELHHGNFGTPGKRNEAAFWIASVNRPKDGVFVRLADMWQFAERDAMQQLIPPLAARIWGVVTKDECFRLLDAILDFLDDLKNAPPDPQLFKDRSLEAFLERCHDDGLDFFIERGGKRITG